MVGSPRHQFVCAAILTLFGLVIGNEFKFSDNHYYNEFYDDYESNHHSYEYPEDDLNSVNDEYGEYYDESLHGKLEIIFDLS